MQYSQAVMLSMVVSAYEGSKVVWESKKWFHGVASSGVPVRRQHRKVACSGAFIALKGVTNT